jgi:hypothetical protein
MRPWSLLLLLSACSPTTPALVRAAPTVAPLPGPPAPPPVAAGGCEATRLLPEHLLAEGHVVVLGEVHGTEASPRAAGDVACQALEAGRRVVLALEIPDEETARLETFLAGGDREALLAGPFWRRDYQDGRSSGAMVELLTRAGALRRAGRPLAVLALDASAPGVDRDAHMAERLLAARRDAPQALVVALVGNLHARPRLSLPRSLAWRVRQAGSALSAVWLASAEGTTWMCDAGTRESCGVHPLRGEDRGPTPFFEAEGAAVPLGFEGLLYLGPARASPPALSAPSGPASLPPPASPSRP